MTRPATRGNKAGFSTLMARAPSGEKFPHPTVMTDPPERDIAMFCVCFRVRRMLAPPPHWPLPPSLNGVLRAPELAATFKQSGASRSGRSRPTASLAVAEPMGGPGSGAAAFSVRGRVVLTPSAECVATGLAVGPPHATPQIADRHAERRRKQAIQKTNMPPGKLHVFEELDSRTSPERQSIRIILGPASPDAFWSFFDYFIIAPLPRLSLSGRWKLTFGPSPWDSEWSPAHRGIIGPAYAWGLASRRPIGRRWSHPQLC